jgi:hypothetical protein
MRLDVSVARDDALRGAGVPAKWRRRNEDVEAEVEANAAKAKLAGAAQEIAAGAEVAGQVGGAAQSLQGAGLMAAPVDATAEALPPNVRPREGQKREKPMLRSVA